MHDYIKWLASWVEDLMPKRFDDGRHCSTCLYKDEVDYAPCNACSRVWAQHGTRVNWTPA